MLAAAIISLAEISCYRHRDNEDKERGRCLFFVLLSTFAIGALSGSVGFLVWQRVKPYTVRLAPDPWKDFRRQIFSLVRQPSIVMLGELDHGASALGRDYRMFLSREFWHRRRHICRRACPN